MSGFKSKAAVSAKQNEPVVPIVLGKCELRLREVLVQRADPAQYVLPQ